MKPVAYHRLAASELIESATFYEKRARGLGDAFLSAIERATEKIAENPGLGRPGKRNTRGWKVKRFPFRVVYLEQPDRLWIVAVAHLSRRPDYWLKRLD